MEKLNELVEQAKEMAVLHGPVWSSALCESGCDGQAIKHHAIISDSKNDFVIDTGSDTNEASWLCDYLELCSPANILAIAEAFNALAAENAILKSGIGFFSYGTDSGFEEHESAEKAIAAADSYIDYYRGDACDGWSEETDQTVWGVIMQRATMIDERPRSEEFPDGSCDYALLPNLATPATDTYLNSVRAEGVDKAIEHLHDRFDSTGHIGVPVMALESLAARLRAGEPS